MPPVSGITSLIGYTGVRLHAPTQLNFPKTKTPLNPPWLSRVAWLKRECRANRKSLVPLAACSHTLALELYSYALQQSKFTFHSCCTASADVVVLVFDFGIGFSFDFDFFSLRCCTEKVIFTRHIHQKSRRCTYSHTDARTQCHSVKAYFLSSWQHLAGCSDKGVTKVNTIQGRVLSELSNFKSSNSFGPLVFFDTRNSF